MLLKKFDFNLKKAFLFRSHIRIVMTGLTYYHLAGQQQAIKNKDLVEWVSSGFHPIRIEFRSAWSGP